MRYHGTAGVFAIVLVALVSTTLAAMSVSFAADAHRTAQLAVDAQLRQLLIAGTKLVQQHPDQDAREVVLPAELHAGAHLRITHVQRNANHVEVTMQAFIERRQLWQTVTFENRDGSWIFASAQLAP